jgi:hypothetical protein
LASAVKREWIEEMFPQHLTTQIEHLFDRTHKRVAAIKLERFGDLVIHHEHQREIDPIASGRCLAEAYRKGLVRAAFIQPRSEAAHRAREPGQRGLAGVGVSSV